ncbi:MAG: transglycosylase SLT domain-containing protein [Rudaea sp.]
MRKRESRDRTADRRNGHAPRRDWRLAALGSGCCSLGIACLTLVACSTAPQRPNGTAPTSNVASIIESPVAGPTVPLLPGASTMPSDFIMQSPWSRLRQRMAMPDCDYNPAVRRWTHAYAQSPVQFAASMSEAMPYLLIVLDEIERRDLPGEFAFLPYIESTYTPIASSGDRAAGIWQLMPDTARETGLSITPDYDGRLDIVASTHAALDLLERYQREFDDWRVVDLAYNVGEYGVKTRVGSGASNRSAEELARLRVNPGAHDHLAKLLAVACVASDPERFHIELPEPTLDDVLAPIELSAPVDLNLIAWIAGIDIAQLRRFNPGYTLGRIPANGPYGLLVPSAQRDQVESALALLPAEKWREWHEISLQQDETVDVLATAHEIDAAAVASINHVSSGGVLPAGQHVLLPGRGSGFPTENKVEPPARKLASAPSIHIVRQGETLWGICRAEHVRLDELLHWNGLQRSTKLHRGQRLRIDASAAESTASTAGGGTH